MTFLSCDNHFETKVLFLMYFGSQIISLRNIMIMQVADHNDGNKMLSYRRETALQGEL